MVDSQVMNTCLPDTQFNHNDSNNSCNCSRNRRCVRKKSLVTSPSIEYEASIFCARCQCCSTKESSVKCRFGLASTFSGVVLLIGLLLVQQAADVTGMTLQHVPGAGGRNSGDPAPGRSPGPPVLLDPPVNYQRLANQPVSSRPIMRHRPEKQPPQELPDRNHPRHQESPAVSSSSSFRDEVTQENIRPTLEEYEFPLGRYGDGGRIPDPVDSLEEETGVPDSGFTIPGGREVNREDVEMLEGADFTRTWHQGSLLDDLEDDKDHNMSEDNPTIILTSDSDQSISLPSSVDFASYEDEENNETYSWCEQVKEKAEPAAELWTELFNTTVTHPLFRTEAGLVRGIVYQVTVTKASAVEEVLMTSQVDGRPRGRFISPWDEDTCPGAEWAVIGRLYSRTSVTFNWSAPVTPGDNHRANVTFRLRFRTQSTKATAELLYYFPLLPDCQLTLWPTRGNVSWRDLPRQTQDCQLFFPSSASAETDRRGLVVELTRLNVPCPAGGYLQFSSVSHGNFSSSSRNRRQQLCGKLEELPPPGRRLYFPAPALSSTNSLTTPSLHLHSSPIFAFAYRLVDYCYNVTLTARNDTLILRPTAELHCTFRIHLPYGNRVSLRLQTGEMRLLSSDEPAHRQEHRSLAYHPEFQDTSLKQLSHTDPDPSCPGLLTRLWDGVSTWTHCSRKGDPRRDMRVISHGNVVTLRVVIQQTPTEDSPALRLWYHAEPIPEIVQQCGFGWVSMRPFCVTVVEDLRLAWHESEMECGRRGGHLVSIRSEQNQDLIDNLLLNSPGYRDHNSYWVGASDKTYEGDFRWSDGVPFSYTNWFPGWAQHNHYNRQPNDDGLSEQDCVELRRVYHLPSANEKLAHSFMWNDRDCATPNLFLCERLRTGVTLKLWPTECNRSVTLSREQPRATVVSPEFPHQYPDNAECDTEITAPPGYRLVLDFEELVLEKEPYCSYDYLEILEIIPGSNSSSSAPTRKLCGDWSSKLKLLRYVSRGPRLRLRFVSDYSHHYGGFKAKVSMENGMECADDRLQMFNGSCYLFVSYPEVTWHTAQQICQGMKAELASIHSLEEENFVTANIRDSTEYSTSAIYWLGGQLVAKSIDHWEWVDGSPLTFSAWLPGQMSVEAEVSDASSYTPMCLGIQWMPSPTPVLPSGLYWQSQRCSTVGGYVCKRGNQVSGSGLQLNRTINGTEGFLTSPNFPGNYYHNLDYWVQLIGPDRTRLVIQFTQLDLEPQPECLYDFVEVRSVRMNGHMSDDAVRWCSSHHSEMEKFNFVSEGNRAILRFHSDYSIAGAGFSATWQAVDISGCPLQTLTAREGTLMSPNYPHFLMAHLDCATTILAPAGRRIWLEFLDYDLGSNNNNNGKDNHYGEQSFNEAILEIDLGSGHRPFQPFQLPGHLTDGAFLSEGVRMHVRLRTLDKPRGSGFKAIYRTVAQVHEERLIDLSNVTVGTLLHLNYPKSAPPHMEFVQHLRAPVGHVIMLELHHMVPSESRNCPGGAGIIEVTDNYADINGTWWFLCEANSDPGGQLGSSTLTITSYFNTLYLRQRSGATGVQLNATVKIYPDTGYRIKLIRGSEDSSVESCYPNPCLNGGKCISSGLRKSCQCTSHFTGMFCALTLCDMQPCAFGQCKLTPTSYACTCLPGYTGSNCEQKVSPCSENPCEGRGECFKKGDSFYCQCHAWWEGQRCEKRMLHIPFKPLSERMLQEPFWLGLITVTVVLGVIGLVWCAKRHFPEKLEKLLAEEADRNRTGCSSHSRPPSVREQLAAAGGATVVVVPSPQPGCPRSLFGRLGIRKPSLLSLTSPHGHNNHPTAASATARTFSLDDLLKPPPRRTPSPRKKRNNSTPTKKNIAEKKQILQQLITPSANQQNPRKVSLGELIQLSERKMREADKNKEGGADGEETETTFSTAMSDSQSAPSTAAFSSIDAKFEKKVTFARLLSKVSAEMSSGSEVEANQTRHPQLSGLPRSNSTPPSPAVDTRSPHSTSSNQGSDSMSSLDASIPLGGSGTTISELLASRRPNRGLQQSGRPTKNPSADSILAMFRNFSSATAGPSAHKVSPSTTPTASSPQDEAAGSDESSSSSVPTPLSSSSFTLDSPPLPHAFHRHNHSNTIEVPVLDALSAHKTSGSGSNLLQPPTILLEIPSGGIGKCLSPIREVPTPLATPSPSPALTPILPRSAAPYLRGRDDLIIEDINPLNRDFDLQLPCIKITNSDDEDESNDEEEKQENVVALEVSEEVAKCESNPTTSSAPEEPNSETSQQSLPVTTKPRPPLLCNSLGPMLVVDDDDGPPCEDTTTTDECSGGENGCCSSRPMNPPPVIPLLTVQQPSPTHNCAPQLIIPGSPPPQRGGMLGGHPESNFLFSGKGPRRLLKELDKPNSLDLPCPPPLITVTCNMSEAESDTESISPAAKNSGPHPGVTGGGVGMCYLSPFSMCSRADRTASESNLSSSGYSSMASPGPSRCGSNNPLCPSEVEDPPGPGSGCGPGTTTLPGHGLIQRKPSPLLRTPASTTCTSEGEGEAERPPEDHGHQGDHCRGRSDSETLSDDLFVESNDEGIGTDHLDEKIEEGELKSAKELEVFIGKELLENGKTLLGLMPINSTRGMTKCGSVDTGLDCCKLLPPTTTPSSKSSLQLPTIVVQTDSGGCEKHLSPVSSRSESPLSDKTCGLGRFSPLFYGRHKSDQLPFTDSDGLYDCPSSDCPLNRVQASTTVQQHRKSTGRRRERRSTSRGGNKTPSPTKVTAFLDIPGKEQYCRPVVSRKPSPKRSRTRTQPRVSSSSSSESLNSTREITIRGSDKSININPDRVSWPGAVTDQADAEWDGERKGHFSVEASGEDTGEEVTSHMLPKILVREDMPKPHRKVSRLRTIGHQIRFLRRLELSLKRRERLVSPSDSVDSCGEEEEDGDGSPPCMSPLLSHHHHHQCHQELHKSSSYGHLQQVSTRTSRGRQKSNIGKQKRTSGVELLLPPEDRTWRQVQVAGGSGHTD